MLRLRSFAGLVALCTCLTLTGMASSTNAAVCDKSTPTCAITVTTSVWTGSPTIFCQANVDVIRITVSWQCAGCSGEETTLRCGNTSESFRVGDNGCNFNVRLQNGHTWSEAVNDCSIIKL